MTLETALRLIESARTYLELFGKDPASRYRKLAKICHPDKVSDVKLKRRSELAFAKLSEFYNNKKSVPDGAKIGPWSIVQPLVSGSISDLHIVQGTSVSAVLKIAKTRDNNQLIVNERKSLNAIWKLSSSSKGGSTYAKYFPKVHDSFIASGKETNVISYHANGYTLEYIKSQFPNGIPFRHIVWMANRVFSAIGFSHRAAIIHGAILPHHLIYLPSNHGLVIIDWTCSVGGGNGHIPIRYTNWKKHYPKEVDKKICYPSTDIFMLMKSMYWASDSIPKRFLPFFELCFLESPKSRPGDAWELQDKWKKLAEEEYGPPSFVELVLNSY